MSKQILPVDIWIDGEVKTAGYLQAIGTYDNYESMAKSSWSLFTSVDGIQGEQISDGTLIISGQDYINWGEQPAMSINDWIYQWVAEQLNLTII
jgi:hypothetical protein